MTSNNGPSAPRSSAATTITIVAAVVGGVVLFGAAVSSTLNVLGAFAPRAGLPFADQLDLSREIMDDIADDLPGYDSGGVAGGGSSERRGDGTGGSGAAEELRAPVTGITGLEIEASASSFTLEFGDVDEAVLVVERDTDRTGKWTMRQDDDELVVERAQGSRTGGCLFGCADRGGREIVTLTLPTSLGEGGRLSGDLRVAAGELLAVGEFADLDLEVSAGNLVFTGAATELDLGVQAGRAEVEAADVRDAQIEVEAGEAVVRLTGSAPALVDLQADAGSADVRLPEGEYRLDVRGELGKIDNRLSASEQSKNVVKVRSSLAEVILR
ncbi:hypothetical protein Leucomu_00075 [Leucobacter muris]|uniref:Adhesin domain-containing protein n=1 Tax=Leucobacter muris TaxID=1935379 RepID=A0ABX5QBU6_9MICO|nr:hypothetical protein [Leucobacter muris]QAB16544.1 hypothetical protein Leucomu_00075 [Leucobacter muris]